MIIRRLLATITICAAGYVLFLWTAMRSGAKGAREIASFLEGSWDTLSGDSLRPVILGTDTVAVVWLENTAPEGSRTRVYLAKGRWLTNVTLPNMITCRDSENVLRIVQAGTCGDTIGYLMMVGPESTTIPVLAPKSLSR